jgi:hypothetical protein
MPRSRPRVLDAYERACRTVLQLFDTALHVAALQQNSMQRYFSLQQGWARMPKGCSYHNLGLHTIHVLGPNAHHHQCAHKLLLL